MKKTTINVFSALAAVTLLVLSTPTASAAGTDTWVGNTDANWNTAANWTTSGGSTPPGTGDSLIFGAAGSAGTSLNNDIFGLSVFNFNINSGASAFTFGGNGITLNGTLTDAAGVNETFGGGVTIGSSVATAIKNTGSGTLALGALSAGIGGTVDFTITGPITTTIANTSGILGGWATTGNNVSSATTGDWVANDGSGNIIAYTGYTVGTVIAGQPATANFKNTANATMTASTTINSLSQWADVTLSSGQTLTVNSGGLILGGISRWMKNGGTGGNALGGNEFLKSGLATGELYVHVPDADAAANNWTIWPIIADNLAATTLIKDGPGLVKLGNYNTYTGGTFVNGGTLQLGNGSGGGGTGFLRGVVTVNSGATLNLSRVDAVGYNAGVCVDTLNVVGGTVANTSGGNEGFLMNINLTGGTVTSTGGKYVFSGGYGINSLASPLTSLISAPLNIQGASTIAVAQGNTASGNDLVLSGVISGVGSVTKTGAGKMIMSGANTYTGDTYISEGVLQLGDGTSASGSLAGNIDNETTLIIANPGAVTIPGVIYSSSAAPVIKTGAGTLTLSGANTYSGPTTMSNGVVLFAAPQSLTGSVTVLDGAGVGVMATTDEVYYSPSSLTLGGTTGAKLQFGVFGTTTAVLNPATLTINGTATINISSAPFVIGASYPLVANYTGGTLALGTQPPGYYGQLTVSGTTVSYMVTNISVDVWTAAVSTNWDTTTANWTNSVGGNLFAANDLVQFDDSAAGTSPLLVNITPSAVTNYSMLVSNTAKSYIIGGLSIGGASSLTKDGNNTLTLTGTNTFTGPTTISAGTVEIGGTGQLGSGAYSAAITDNGILSINSSAAQTLSGVISGGGSLVKSNTGTLILSAANTFSGGSSISNGTVQLSNGAGLGSAAVNLNGGTLQATAAITVANDIVSGGGGTISIPATAGNDFTLAGTLSGTGPLTLGGGGPIKSLNLSFAANTLSGNITIPASPNQTVVRFKTTTAGSPTAAWAITGDTTTRFVTLDFVGTLEFGSLSGPAILSGNGAGLKTLSVGALGTDSTFSGSIRNGSGTAALTKVGAGKLTLTGASTFTAGVNINEGTLSVSNASAISTSGTITFGGGALQYTPANQVDYSARIANSASPILIDVNGTNVTYATALPASNTGGLALTNSIGAGVLTLTANNLFTGTTLINAGTLALSGSGNIGSSTNISVASGATFDVSGATYTLGSAQTLSGSGTVTGAVATASIGSSITPGGAGTVGTLTFKNNLNMSSGASPVFDLSTSSASGNDQIVVAGALTLGSADAIHVNALSGSANLDQAADYILFSVTGTTTMTGQPVLVFDNTAPANFSHYSIKTSSNNVVLRYSASSTPVITSVVVTNTADGSTVGTRGQSVTVYVTVTPGLGTVTNVSADLSPLGGSAAQSLTPLGGNQYSYTLLLGPGATVGLDTVNVSATDTTPLSGFGSANFTVNALTETWNGLALDDNWSSATNWVGDLPPGYVGDPVIFTGSTRTTPVVDNNYSVAGLTFDGAASSFAITNAPGKTLTLAGGVTNSSASAQALDLPIILNGTQTIEDQSSAGIALGGSVGSAVLGSGLTVNAGIVTLAGSNTYSGDTTIAVGTLKVANSAAIPSGSGKGNVILAGTLDINGTNAFINNLQGGAGVVDNTSATSASTLTLGENNDAISLTGVTVQNSGGTNLSLVKVGTGDLAMASANTFSGGLTVSNGTALLGNNNAAGSGTITLAGGTLQNSVNNLTLANNIDVTAASAMTIGSGLNWQINGNLTGSGNITYSPANFAATLALAGDNSGYSGTFTVNGANAAFQWMTASAGSANAAWVLNNTWSGGTRMRFSGAWNGTIELGSLSGNGIGLVNNNAGTVIMSVGALNTSTLFSGTMIVNAANIIALTKVGTGTLTLSGANSYTGLTTVSNGTLVITTAHLGNGDFAVNDNKTLGVINNGGSQTALLNNLTLGDTAGPTKLFFTNVASTTIPVITAASAVTRNGTCNIAISNSVVNTGGVYPLVKYGSLAGAGSFVLSSVPSGVTATLTNDTSNLWIALAVSVGNGVNTSPTNITSVVNGTSLELSWPADHIGWRLQVQTNSLSTGLGTNWVDVPNTGTVSSYTNVVNPANGSVFYRMVYP